MILLIDHADSFTYNLAQLIEELGHLCQVVRHDQMTLQQIQALNPHAIVLSPGPGRPLEAPRTLEVIHALGAKIPILGVCLGHQALGHAFGAVVDRAPKPVHGKLSTVRHDGRGVFRHLPSPLEVVRYHSLVVREEALPSCLEVTARNEEGLIMGLRHRTAPMEGVQFHPESIASEGGRQMMANFLSQAKEAV